MKTFETDQPIALSIELSHGVIHVIASDRTDTVVAVNPSGSTGFLVFTEFDKELGARVANRRLAERSTQMQGAVLSWRSSLGRGAGNIQIAGRRSR